MTKNLLKYSLLVLGLALGTCVSAHGMVFAPLNLRLIRAWPSAASPCLRERSRFCVFVAASRRKFQ